MREKLLFRRGLILPILAGAVMMVSACAPKSGHVSTEHGEVSKDVHQENIPSEAHAKEHALFTGAVMSFHDVMSPDWHAEEGPARVKSTCANLGKYSLEAMKIKQEPVPHGVAKLDWDKATLKLLDGLTDLGRACHSDRTSFEDGFTNVHDGFHGLKDLLQAAQ